MSSATISLPFKRSHAFIIGINDYAHITPLKTAVNDAKGIAMRLEAQHGYEVHEPLLNPTKAELETLFFETMQAEVGEEDRVVFYFAGHGIALDGEEGPNGYIVPADAKQGNKETLIPMNDLHQTLNDLPCRHGLLILDCCFSGAFKWSTGYRDFVFDMPKVIYEERFWRYVKDPAWQVITSSAYDQKAVDVISNQSIGMREEGQGQHSPFATALFEALEGAGDVIPTEQGDGVITTSELYAYLRDSVENQTADHVKSQSPSMFNLARHDKGEFVFLNPRHRFNLPPTPDRNPFMGLASYNEADSNFFFGRDRVIAALLEKVESNRLIVVSGVSGTGKSSVIKAGLLPILRKKDWQLLPVLRPGKNPLQILGEKIGMISEKLSPSQNNLLIVDQYEELITQCLHEEDRFAFENQLAEWINEYPYLKIILSVRADFEPQFESQVLAPWWPSGRYVVPTFSLEEIREVITQPALQSVLFYEPAELVDCLEEDVSQAPGALPLLSFTLSELYYSYLSSGREDRSLAKEDYDALGGVIGALRTKANETYAAQDQEHQDAMRKLMLRMVSLEGGELAGKRIFAEELIYADEQETKRIEKVAGLLVDARLILSGKNHEGKIYLEPAHDALVRAWARLWDWIKVVGETKLNLMYKLNLAVFDYYSHQTDPQASEYLWNADPRLDLLYVDLSHEDHLFNQREEQFLRESMALRLREARRRRLLLTVAIIILLFISALAVWQSLEAKKEAERADENAKEATIQKDSAIDAKERAVHAKVLADSLKKEAETALENLQSATSTIVHNILEEVDEHVLMLEYDKAEEKLVGASKLGSNIDEIARKLTEIAFVYNETERLEKAVKTVQLILSLRNKSSEKELYLQVQRKRNQNQTFLRKCLRRIFPDQWNSLMQRYFPVMLFIEGGTFQMIECDTSDNWLASSSSIELDNYELAKTETSIWQYYIYKTANHEELLPTECWGLKGNDPKSEISWYDGIDYANWLSHTLGLAPVYDISAEEKNTQNKTVQADWNANGFRLPTEAEWEYAARGGMAERATIYSGSDSIEEVATFQGNNLIKGTRKAFPIASRKANSLGLYDMSGNLFEWCWDWKGPCPPFNQKNYRGPIKGEIRIYRGGSWQNVEMECRVGRRNWGAPASGSLINGLRIARNNQSTQQSITL